MTVRATTPSLDTTPANTETVGCGDASILLGIADVTGVGCAEPDGLAIGLPLGDTAGVFFGVAVGSGVADTETSGVGETLTYTPPGGTEVVLGVDTTISPYSV